VEDMKGRLSVNMMANIASFAISLLVSMWLTPFIINTLGAEAYGFIPLTQQLINYMSVITVALNGMASRFFTYAAKSGDRVLAEQYFNTSLVSSSVLALFIVIPLGFMTCFINRIINVPEHLLIDVQISLVIYGVVFILSLMGTAFGMAQFCENRLDISGVLSSVNTVLRSLSILLLLNLFVPKMWYVSLGTLIASVFYFLQNVYYFRKLMPDISFSTRRFSFLRLKELLSSGAWNSVNFIGATLFLQIDMLVANWALGAKLAGEFSALLQLSNLLRAFVSAVIVVFNPTMVELYAKKDMQALVRYSNKAVKITGMMMALPVGLACGLGGTLLTLWLGEGFSGYDFLFGLMTVHLSVNLAVQPLFGIFSAANHVRIPAVVTMTMGAANFILTVVLSMVLGMGAWGIVIAGMIDLTDKNLIFTPIYSAMITKQPLTAYYKGISMPVAGVAFVVSIGIILQRIFPVSGWIGLLSLAAVISVIYCIAVFLVVLDEDEQQRVKAVIMRKLNASIREV